MSEQPEKAPGRTNPETGVPVSAPQAGWPERVDTGPQQVSYRIPSREEYRSNRRRIDPTGRQG